MLAGGYVGYAAVRHERPVSLPAPTGRYPVGRAIFTWADTSRTDPLRPGGGGGPRWLSVWLWFPARSAGAAGRAAYLPGAWGGLHLPAPVGWAETGFGRVDAHTLEGARVAAGRFPVVVLLPGLGFAAPQYTAVAVDLASHGFLVAGVTPTYSANLTVLDGHPVTASASGNPGDLTGEHTRGSTRAALRLMRVWASDARFAAARVRALGKDGRFAGHVDGSRVAYVGHSFGGTSALEACRLDARCVAAADLDGAEFGDVVSRGAARPLLLLGHQGSCVTGLCRPRTSSDRVDLAVARRLLSRSRGHAWSVSVDGTGHFSFTDYAAYYLAFPLRLLLPVGDIDGDRALRITGRCTTGFLVGAFGGRSDRPPCGTPPPPDVQTRAW